MRRFQPKGELRPQVGDLFREEPLAERQFEHGLSEAEIQAILHLDTERTSLSEMENSGRYLVALRLILPNRFEERRVDDEQDEFWQSRLPAYVDAVTSNRPQPKSNYDILLQFALMGHRLAPEQEEQLFSFPSYQNIIDGNTAVSLDDWRFSLLFAMKLFAPDRVSGSINTEWFYQSLTRGGLSPEAYQGALYLRLVYPEQNVQQVLGGLGFSDEKLTGLVTDARTRLARVIREKAVQQEIDEQAYGLVRVLALQAVLVADRVELGADGRPRCVFVGGVENDRPLPDRKSL